MKKIIYIFSAFLLLNYTYEQDTPSDSVLLAAIYGSAYELTNANDNDAKFFYIETKRTFIDQFKTVKEAYNMHIRCFDVDHVTRVLMHDKVYYRVRTKALKSQLPQQHV